MLIGEEREEDIHHLGLAVKKRGCKSRRVFSQGSKGSARHYTESVLQIFDAELFDEQ
jgi:hypothetical protein